MVKPYEDPRMQVDLAGVTMKTPVTTASGTFGFGLEFTDFLNLDHIGAITVKGTTLKPRPGNKGQRVVETPAGVLTCVGLENPGVEFFLKETLPQLPGDREHRRGQCGRLRNPGGNAGCGRSGCH